MQKARYKCSSGKQILINLHMYFLLRCEKWTTQSRHLRASNQNAFILGGTRWMHGRCILLIRSLVRLRFCRCNFISHALSASCIEFQFVRLVFCTHEVASWSIGLFCWRSCSDLHCSNWTTQLECSREQSWVNLYINLNTYSQKY